MNSWCIPNLFSAPCLQLTSSVCSKSPVYFQASSTSMIRHLSAGLPALCRACLVVISIFDSALALLPVPFRPLLMLLPPTHPSASRATASVFSEQRATSCAPCPRGWSRACHGGRSRAGRGRRGLDSGVSMEHEVWRQSSLWQGRRKRPPHISAQKVWGRLLLALASRTSMRNQTLV